MIWINGSKFIEYMGCECNIGSGVFQKMDVLKRHCLSVDDPLHKLFHCYLMKMYQQKMELFGNK